MIISGSKNFIFLHSRKTGGSSIALSLARSLEPEDIMVGCWAEARSQGIPYNNSALRIIRNPVSSFVMEAAKNLVQSGKFEPNPALMNRKIVKYYRHHCEFDAGGHTSALAVRNYDPELWRRSFKFTFVRNPWTHAVSDYYWRTSVRKEKAIGFKEFLRRLGDRNRPDPEKLRPRIITNWSVYTIDDEIAVDFVGKYEDLEDGLKIISQKIGFDLSANTFKAKSGIRNRKKSISDHYDEENVELVRSIYKNEVEAFSYQVPF